MSFTVGYSLVYLAVALVILAEFNAETQNELDQNQDTYNLIRLGIFYSFRLLSL